jgi:hypothetical protein
MIIPAGQKACWMRQRRCNRRQTSPVLRTDDDSGTSPAFTSNCMHNFTMIFTRVLSELDRALVECHSSSDGVDVPASVVFQAQSEIKLLTRT